MCLIILIPVDRSVDREALISTTVQYFLCVGDEGSGPSSKIRIGPFYKSYLHLVQL